jgi:cytochrome c biogenesis protein CcmG/thiol:disulfide interchange protein DsbE
MGSAGQRLGRAGAIALVAALLVLLVVHIATAQRGAAVAAAVAAGKQPVAPDFELGRIDGRGKLKLSSLRGRVVVLNFWASWCRACKDEARTLGAAADRWQRRGVVFVGIDSQDFTGDARAFARRFGLTYASVHDGSGGLMTRYGVTGMPETWTVDRRGRLIDHIAGATDAARLDGAINRARGSR